MGKANEICYTCKFLKKGFIFQTKWPDDRCSLRQIIYIDNQQYSIPACAYDIYKWNPKNKFKPIKTDG